MRQYSDEIHAILEQAFQPCELHVEDESWKHAGHAGVSERGGSHFSVSISAEIFAGKSRLACHRLINQALSEQLKTTIHALSIHCKAP